MSSNWSQSSRTDNGNDKVVIVAPELNRTDLCHTSYKESEDSQRSHNNQVSSNACDLYWKYLTKRIEDNFFVISLHNDVESVIQMGPKCGLVALLMCRPLVTDCKTIADDVNQNDLFDIAKQMGFTKTGEMFSVENMAKLANKVLSVRTEVKENLKERTLELMSHLAKGMPVLVPYDSDANHEPTLLAGERAHWAIILGFCVAIKTELLSLEQLDVMMRDEKNPQLFHLNTKCSLSDSIQRLIDDRKYEKIWVYARQGKSKHLHIWDLDRLCQSNCNLIKTSRKLNDSDIVLPENGGIIEGLNNKCLFISKY